MYILSRRFDPSSGYVKYVDVRPLVQNMKQKENYGLNMSIHSLFSRGTATCVGVGGGRGAPPQMKS